MSGAVVLVTGGSGFIGTWVLRELLNANVQIVVVDKQPALERWARVMGTGSHEISFSDVLLTDRDGLERLLRQYSVTHVIHLAALLTPDCQNDPWYGCQVNILGSTAVFDASRRVGSVQAIAYASSYAVYGDRTSDEPVAPSPPPTFYGAFKQAVDGIAAQYWQHFGLRSIAVRPHVVYGPEREFGLTAGPSLACRAAVCGEPYVIGYTGVVGYDYVEDVARAFVRGVLECPAGATIVDLPSEPATPDEFVRCMTTCLPRSAELISVSGPSIPPNVPPHSRDIRKTFTDWRATSLMEGVARTIAYHQNTGGHR